MLQVECHPYLQQKKLKAYLESVGVLMTSYSPLGSPDRPWAKPDEEPLLANKTLAAIAKKYNKSVAQIILRWQVTDERGFSENLILRKIVTKGNMGVWK